MSGRALRRAAAAGLIASSALALTGCLGLRGVSASQPGVLGDVQVTGTVCAAETPGCPGGRGNSDTTLGDGGSGQLLVGYRVPAAARAPEAIAGAGMSFARSPSYEAELQRLAPAAAGSRWAGYLSAPTKYSAAADAAGRVVDAVFGLPPAAPGDVVDGPFRYRMVVGGRGVTAASPASRPVSCGATLFDEQTDGDSLIVCADGPTPAEVATDLAAPVQDLTVLAGAERVPATPGSVAVVPFTLRNGGRGARAMQVALSAATTLPGAAVAPSPGTLVPTPEGDHQALVVVGIPSGAKSAIHGVTLRATVAGGAAREMTTRIVVKGRAVRPSASGKRPRAVRLNWRDDRRARFYNLQLFSGRRKVVTLFPSGSQRLVRLRPGRYRMIVWTGLARTPARYVPRPWVNRTITIRARPAA